MKKAKLVFSSSQPHSQIGKMDKMVNTKENPACTTTQHKEWYKVRSSPYENKEIYPCTCGRGFSSGLPGCHSFRLLLYTSTNKSSSPPCPLAKANPSLQAPLILGHHGVSSRRSKRASSSSSSLLPHLKQNARVCVCVFVFPRADPTRPPPLHRID